VYLASCDSSCAQFPSPLFRLSDTGGCVLLGGAKACAPLGGTKFGPILQSDHPLERCYLLNLLAGSVLAESKRDNLLLALSVCDDRLTETVISRARTVWKADDPSDSANTAYLSLSLSLSFSRAHCCVSSSTRLCGM